ncbi:hypothetical protein HDV01_007092 [Terramyces sp. JEL0728]|nr:hypothetical protein HDV01_007092 [Terramyces sp. JEL0728]
MKKIPTDFLSLITNAWMTPIMKRLDIEFPENIKEVQVFLQPLMDHLERYQRGSAEPPKLYVYLFHMFKHQILLMTTLQLVTLVMGAVKPLLIAQFLSYLDPSSTDPLWLNNVGYSLAVLIVISLIKPVLESITASLDQKLENRYWAAMCALIYKKTLKLSPFSRLKYEAGNIMNLYDRDVDRVYAGLTIVKNSLYPILLIMLNLIFLENLIGVAAIYPIILFFILLIPIGWLQVKGVSVDTGVNILADKRANLLGECFKSKIYLIADIKNIKFSNIEQYFSKRVMRNINDHAVIRTKTYLITRIKLSLIQALSTVLCCFTFVIYTLLGNELTPTVVFPTFLYLDGIAAQIQTLKDISSQFLGTYEGYQLMSNFLWAEEHQSFSQTSKDADVAIQLKKVDWKWYDSKYIKKLHDYQLEQKRHITKKKQEEFTLKENTDTFELKDLMLTIKKGSLVGVVGAVGAGKSTLFAGLTSGLKPIGKVIINGDIAYYTQEPWIISDDIKTNITFGKDLDYGNLEKIVKACGLVKDLNLLEDGIHSKLGESGINLSGGQKARVALARCLYANADIYLLDDPLAALDAYVGKQVFERAIKRELAGKTVLLATHQLQYMQQMDQILVLDQGKVIENGTFEELMDTENGVFKGMMANFSVESEQDDIAYVNELEELSRPLNKEITKIPEFVQPEKKQNDNIPFSLYKMIFRGIKSPLWFPMIAIGYVLNFAVEFIGLIVITAWANDSSRNTYYIELLLISTAARLIVFYLLNIGWYFGGLDNYKYFYAQSLKSIFNAPQYFFDENPSGRILNRFTLDLFALDHELFISMYNSIVIGLSFVGKNILVCFASPILVVLLLFAYSIIWHIRDIYDKATLDFRRYFALYQASGNAIKAETFTGLGTITFFDAGSSLFEQRFYNFFGKFSRWVAMIQYNQLWYKFRVAMINSVISIGIISAALLKNERSTYFSALVGLALTQSESCTLLLMDLILYMAFWKSYMNSFERVVEYMKETPQEGPRELPKDPQEKTWPSNGTVDIKNLTMAYHSKLNTDVIKNLSISIKAREKVGIVGRTGSGKSTLALAFFRILEPKSGSIIIDERDIAEMGLDALRRNLHIIAQEANIFPGTIRYNLCLDSSFGDEELWGALDMVGMKEFVSQLPDKLDHELTGKGNNLSAGQGQLLCLARALVKKPKLLILDEASSSIDGEADKLLQSVLRKSLRDTTIISIAHRLNTIADFDRVLVLDQGRLSEYDAPHILLQDEDSEFTKLVESSGSSNAAAIRQIAKSKYGEIQ